MSDSLKIDSHKLIYHPKRVAQWVDVNGSWEKAKSVYPLYVEIGPVGACNHRCTFCSVDYIGYKMRTLPYEALIKALTEMAQSGVKSVMFAGEGEPTLYKKLPEVLDHCTEVGIDTSLTTNMVPFTERNVESFVRNCSWIKTSINAGSRESYAKIHGAKEKDYDLVLKNLRMAVEARDTGGHGCTIGGQILLLPENSHEVVSLAEQLRDIGVDYLVVKPYTQSLYGKSRIYEGTKYDQYHAMADDLRNMETDKFKVIYRRETMDKLNETERPYDKCNATPYFWAYIMASGDLYGCSAFLEDDRFRIGNISEASFQDLWQGEGRKKIFNLMNESFDISKCRVNCRMDSVNRYLWTLTNPGNHVNFI